MTSTFPSQHILNYYIITVTILNQTITITQEKFWLRTQIYTVCDSYKQGKVCYFLSGDIASAISPKAAPAFSKTSIGTDSEFGIHR